MGRQSLSRLLDPVGYLIAMASWMAAAPISLVAFALTHWPVVDPIFPLVAPGTLAFGGFFIWGALDLGRMALRRSTLGRSLDANAPTGSRVPMIPTLVLVLTVLIGGVCIWSVLDNSMHTFGILLIFQGGASVAIAMLMTTIILRITHLYALDEQGE